MIKRIALILLSASIARADCDIASVLTQIRPGAAWTLSNNDPATLVWISTNSAKPTLQEINTGLADCPNQVNLSERSDAVNELLNGQTDRDKLNRAILLTLLDQLNVIRGKLVPALGAITIPQARQAVQDKINSGASD